MLTPTLNHAAPPAHCRVVECFPGNIPPPPPCDLSYAYLFVETPFLRQDDLLPLQAYDFLITPSQAGLLALRACLQNPPSKLFRLIRDARSIPPWFEPGIFPPADIARGDARPDEIRKLLFKDLVPADAFVILANVGDPKTAGIPQILETMLHLTELSPKREFRLIVLYQTNDDFPVSALTDGIGLDDKHVLAYRELDEAAETIPFFYHAANLVIIADTAAAWNVSLQRAFATRTPLAVIDDHIYSDYTDGKCIALRPMQFMPDTAHGFSRAINGLDAAQTILKAIDDNSLEKIADKGFAASALFSLQAIEPQWKQLFGSA